MKPIKKDMSWFFKNKPRIPPLEERTDYYGKLLYKAKKLIKLFDKVS